MEAGPTRHDGDSTGRDRTPAPQPVTRHPLAPGVVLYVLPAPRFATLHALVAQRHLLARETVTFGSLLPRVLRRGTRRFPDRTALAGHLEDLYGAALGASSSKAGDHQVLEYTLSCPGPAALAGIEGQGQDGDRAGADVRGGTVRSADARGAAFRSERTLFGEGLGLLTELMTDPAPAGGPADAPSLSSGGLRPDYVAEEKAALARDIAALKDDRMAYAHYRCLEETCQGEPFALNSLGRVEDVEKITPESLDAFRRDILARDHVAAYLAGPVDDDIVGEAAIILGQALASGSHDRSALPASEPHESRDGEKEVFEEAQVEQGRLVIGLSTGVILTSPDYPAQVMYNGLLGGFVHSRLFRRVREEAGLAYYAYSRLIPSKGIILISCGIQEADYAQAVDLIREELASLGRGDFTAEEFSATRNSVLAVSKAQLDSPSSLIFGHMERVAAGEELEEIAPWRSLAKVTPDHVKEFASRPVLDTIYLLGRAAPGAPVGRSGGTNVH